MHCTDTHLADGLELFIFVIIAGQQEAPVCARPLAFPQVGTDHTQINCVTYALQVVLLQLQERTRVCMEYVTAHTKVEFKKKCLTIGLN